MDPQLIIQLSRTFCLLLPIWTRGIHTASLHVCRSAGNPFDWANCFFWWGRMHQIDVQGNLFLIDHGLHMGLTLYFFKLGKRPIYSWISHDNPHLWGIFYRYVTLPDGYRCFARVVSSTKSKSWDIIPTDSLIFIGLCCCPKMEFLGLTLHGNLNRETMGNNIIR